MGSGTIFFQVWGANSTSTLGSLLNLTGSAPIVVAGNNISCPTCNTGLTGSAPIVVSANNVSCPTCSTGGGSYIQLAQTILSSPAASISFTGISGAYSQLELYVTGRSATSAASDTVDVAFNSDTTVADYNIAYLNGDSTGAQGGVTTGTRQLCSFVAATGLANYASQCKASIGAYSGTTFYKSAFITNVLQASNSTTNAWYNSSVALNWANTSAITTITLTLASSDNFVTGTTATLYAIQ